MVNQLYRGGGMFTVLEGGVAEGGTLGGVVIGVEGSSRVMNIDAAGNIEMPEVNREDNGYDGDVEEDAPPAKLAVKEVQKKKWWQKLLCC